MIKTNNITNTITNDEVIKKEQKRPPGRPPGKKIEIKTEKLGIVNNPNNILNKLGNIVFQLTYDNPVVFKNLFNIYKKYDTSIIEICFDKEKTYIYAKDHNDEVVIFCELYGKNMNRYYCNETIKMSFTARTIFKTFDGISRIFNSINFIVLERSKRSKLIIIFKNDDQTSQYTIDILSTKCEMITDDNITKYSEKEKDYPINFTMNLKEMKPKLSELSHISKVIEIEQGLIKTESGVTKQIMFKCSSDNSNLTNKSTFTNKNYFNLQSTFNDPYFYISLYIKNIKPFVVSLTKNKAIFYLQTGSSLVVKSLLDIAIDKNKKVIPNSEIGYIKIIAKIVTSRDD